MTDLENREAFEKWFKKSMYHKHLKENFWDAWNASAQREGFKLAPLEPSEEMYSDLSRHLCRYMQMKDRYCPKTLGEYIKRYIGFKNIPQWLNDEVQDWDSTHAFATADLGVFIYKAMINAV